MPTGHFDVALLLSAMTKAPWSSLGRNGRMVVVCRRIWGIVRTREGRRRVRKVNIFIARTVVGIVKALFVDVMSTRIEGQRKAI